MTRKKPICCYYGARSGPIEELIGDSSNPIRFASSEDRDRLRRRIEAKLRTNDLTDQDLAQLAKKLGII